jgi:hypothetical protein
MDNRAGLVMGIIVAAGRCRNARWPSRGTMRVRRPAMAIMIFGSLCTLSFVFVAWSRTRAIASVAMRWCRAGARETRATGLDHRDVHY